jgi:LysM domain
MAAVLQLEPRYLDPRFLDPSFDEPVVPGPHLRLLEADRQYRPRPARRHQRAVYRRRRVLAALVGLGLLLTVARAGATLGGASLAAPERLPHVQHIVVQPGDTLWSIASRAAPGHDLRPIVDKMVQSLGTSTVVAGETITVATP